MKSIILLLLFIFIYKFLSAQEHRDILIEHMDPSVNPAVDFFNYANGGWIKQNQIPASESRWGIANLVRNETYDRMLKVSEESTADLSAVQGSNSQKIGDFYFMGMDTIKIDEQGITPLGNEFELINSVKDKNSLFDAIARLQMIGGSPLIGPYVFQDEKKSDEYALYLWQTGIGLPDRDYYFNDDTRTKNIREEYVKHLVKMFQLMGDTETDAVRNAATVMKIETELARSSRKLEDLRDPYANYNKMSMNDLNQLTPNIKWDVVFSKMHLRRVDSVIVGQPEFYKQVDELIKTISLDEWKTYLRWNLVNNYVSYLSKPFDKQNFEFFGKVLSGAEEQRPRWKRILDNQENFLGDALGQLYVEKYYSPETKKRYEDLTDKVMDAYRERILKLDWMSEETKQKALLKLSTVRKKVGYPDKWKDYSSMNISRDSYAGNILQGNLWYYDYYTQRLGKPVDREEWGMTPQTYNAYYSSSNNEIVLPAAAFIIPGLPDSLADDAIIYGYAGASTIGHEITHGFDDNGRQYDAYGNLSNWWTKTDEDKFNERAQLYINQFNNYIVLDSMHINGEATLGENIADLGGLVIALDAFKKTDQCKNGEKISGLTPLQRYFLGYSLGWLSNQRDEYLAQQIMTDVHSPAFLRVNGPMSVIPEFYEAFNVKDGDPMWRAPAVRTRIW